MDILFRGGIGQIDRFGDRIVRMPLEGGLHAQMPHRRDVHGRDKGLAQGGREKVHVLNGALGRHAFHELRAGKAGIGQGGLKIRIDLHQAFAVEDIAGEAEREQRLHARRAARDDGERARGRDGGHGGVAVRALAARRIDGRGPRREGAALPGELRRCLVPLVLDKGHEPLAQGHAFRRVIGHAKLKEQVGKAHDAQADLAVPAHGLVDHGQGEARGVDDIVEKAHGQMDGAAKALPVHAVVRRVLLRSVPRHMEAGEVDGPQIAGLERQQGLFAARIGGFDLALVRRGVVAIDAVKEHDAGIAGLPRLFHEQIKNLPRGQPPRGFARGRQAQVIVLAALHGLHEGFGQAHGKIEVVEFPFPFLGADEVHDIRMVHAEDAHIGAAPRAALLDLLGGGIEDAQEGNRPGGHAAGGAHAAFPGPQPRKGKTRAAAGLVDHGRVLDGIKDLLDGIPHRQDKTGGKLAQIRARVHERGRVGEKLPARHEVVKFARQRLRRVGRFRIPGLFPGYGRGHTPEQTARIFRQRSFRILAKVALFQHNFGIGLERGPGQIPGHGHHGAQSVGLCR